MVGNDIVDHDLARKLSRWESARFRHKIFTKSELNFLSNNESDFENIWRLWSMKESAYKIYVQKTGLTFRNPHRIIVESLNDKDGIVSIANFIYYTNTISNIYYTFTQASDIENEHLHSHIFEIPKGLESNYCQQKLLQGLAEANHYNVKDLQLIKNKVGVPHVYHKNIQLPNSVSISHHHSYGAISFQ